MRISKRLAFYRAFRWITVIILIQAVALLVIAWKVSPTYDEWMYVPSGIYHWVHQDFSPYRVNPPLPRLIASLPLYLSGVDVPFAGMMSSGNRIEIQIADRWVEQYGPQTLSQIFVARLTTIAFAITGTLVIAALAREIFGDLASLISSMLWAFSPTILTHGSLATPDIPSTVLLVASILAFVRWFDCPTWASAAHFGGVLGLLLLSKSTWILLFLLFPFMLLALQYRDRTRWLKKSSTLIAVLCFSLLILNAGYRFDGTGTALKEHEFVSKALSGCDRGGWGNRFASSFVGELPLPLPSQFILGVDQQKFEFETGFPCYFWGEWHDHGFPLYYIYCFAWKEPIAVLLLCALCLRWVPFIEPNRLYRFAVISIPPLAIFTLASFQTGIHQHYRYVIFALPFVYLPIGACWHAAKLSSRYAITCLVGAASVSSLVTVPRTHAYFNVLAGGGERNWSYLSNSNIDWGQDLKLISQHIRKHPEIEFNVLHITRWDLRFLGLDCNSGRQSLMVPSPRRSGQFVPYQPGVYLVGITEFIRKEYAFFRENECSEVLPGGIRVYLVTQEMLSTNGLHEQARNIPELFHTFTLSFALRRSDSGTSYVSSPPGGKGRMCGRREIAPTKNDFWTN
ncbi:glycosyltransferase family 39 protein [Roseiconus lacunae]|uniref:ArnT family glycosyltransferase n=1 Tax=Roseiconus lacunae TaxID=2605694 RepID=UPI0030926E90|nr:glycosyltransferase family 39 protein [Stieleria sp. HD01]